MNHADPETGAAPGPVSRYREFAPPPPLARYLVCTWAQVVSGSARVYPHRVLPDGCVDIVCVGGAAPAAVGPATGMFIAALPPETPIVGVRFRPGWAPVGLSLPASELLDREVALGELWGDAADRLSDEIERRPSIADRLGALEQSVLARCSRARHAPDPLAAAAVAWLARHPGGRVDRLARELGVGPRQLHRRFAAAVGYAPKTFQRVARFQRLLALAHPRRVEPVAADRAAAILSARPGGAQIESRPSLTRLALEAGYADQAHMTREVGALAGRTPAALLGLVPSTLALSDLFDTTP